jgi:hypothetical protein
MIGEAILGRPRRRRQDVGGGSQEFPHPAQLLARVVGCLCGGVHVMLTAAWNAGLTVLTCGIAIEGLM